MGFLHIWTTTFRWRVSYETASVSRSAGQLLVFLINDSLNFFLKFYIKLEGLKSRKLTELKFSKKFLRWGKSPNFLENVFLAFAKNLIHWYIFYPKIAQTVVFDSTKITCLWKIWFLSYSEKCTQPRRLQDSLIIIYLWKELIISQIFCMEIIIKER